MTETDAVTAELLVKGKRMFLVMT